MAACLARLEAFLCGLALADVLEAVHAADEASLVVEQRIEIGKDGDARAVRPLEDELTVANGLAGGEQFCHRRGFRRKLPAIGGEGPGSAAQADLPIADIGGSAPDLRGVAIILNEAAFRVAGIDADRQPLEKPVPRKKRPLQGLRHGRQRGDAAAIAHGIQHFRHWSP